MSSGKILVIEDQRHIARFIEFVLERHNYEVLLANCGGEALKALNEFKPDAVVLDLGLPDMNGAEVLKAIRADEKYAATKVMVLTATLDNNCVSELDQHRADAQCSKPIAPSMLIRTLENFNLLSR